ncbi:MAG: arylesterase [Pseudomonadota bacterium]
MKISNVAFVMACFLILGLSGDTLAETRILILGDSLTAGLGVEQNQAWPSLVESRLKQLGHGEITIVNGSISGSTTASALSRLTWHMKIRPHLLVLALGANDGLRGLPLDAMKENLDKTIRLALANNITVILAGMRVPPNYGEDYSRGFSRVFSDLAGAYRLRFIPFLLEGVGAHPELNQADGIHPNSQGHRVIAETVLPFILGTL